MTIKADPLWAAMHDLPVEQLRRNRNNLLVQASRCRRAGQATDLVDIADRIDRIIEERENRWLRTV